MIYSKKELKRFLSITQEAALRAGNFLAGADDTNRNATRVSRRDVKIRADFESERIIIDILRKRTSIPVLAEESGVMRGNHQGSRLTWIIDPLDGSLNFHRRIPLSCVSIGLWDGTEPLVGTIYDFNKSELFSGIAGEGAWLNSRKIHVSGISGKKNAVLVTGFPSKSDFSRKALSSFIGDVRKYKKVRLFGSAALSLAYVAAGRADVYCENNISLWDIAAGLAIVSGAGGAYDIKPAADKTTFFVYASNSFFTKPRWKDE